MYLSDEILSQHENDIEYSRTDQLSSPFIYLNKVSITYLK